MNRDELHSRGHAHPVAHHAVETVPYLSPVDTDGGGSWIAANLHGLTACLLNNYPPGAAVPGRPATPARSGRDREFTSRGVLLTSLMDARSVDEVETRLRSTDLSRYRPFYVFALGSEAGAGVVAPALFRWDGEGELAVDRDPSPPVTTSSFDTAAVIRSRTTVYRALFGASTPGPAGLAQYHRSHDPERGPYSVCVHRKDAATKSLSHVAVRSDAVMFEYADGPPCEDGPVTVARLARREG